MRGQPYFYFWLSFGFYMHKCSAQELQFYTFTQEHCQTKCTHGLINSLDSCQIDLKVQFHEFVPKSTLFYFEDIRDDLQNIFSLDIPSECTGYKQNANNYCTQINKTTFNVTVIVSAQPKFSNMQFRGYFKTSNGGRIESELLTFPEIHDSTNVTGKMLINEEIISNTEDCIMMIEKNDLILQFDCLSTATPCLIEIRVNDSVVNTTSGNRGVYRRTLENREELVINISYAACSMDRNFKTIACRIKQDSQYHLKYISSSNDTELSISVSSSISVIILSVSAIVCIVLRKKICKLCHQTNCRKRTEHKPNKNGSSEIAYQTTPSTGLEDGRLEAISLKETDKTEKDEPEKERLLKTVETDCMKTTFRKNNSKDEKQGVLARNSLILQLEGNEFDAAKISINNGADVNQVENKKTALMLACEKRRYSICLELIERGARVNEQNTAKSTALMIACKNGSENIVGILIENGADLEMKNIWGHTALMIACKHGHYKTAEMLINRGAEVNATDKFESTPLIAACENGHHDVVSLLIDKNANMYCTLKDGKTAFIIAEEKENEKMCQLLREKMK